MRSCAKLARHENIQKYIPEEDRDKVGKSESTTALKEALARGEFSCGDGTIEGCGTFCLNQSAEARGAGVSAIPPICREIAARFFGPEGEGELELAYGRVQGTFDEAHRRLVEGDPGNREGTSTPQRPMCPMSSYAPCPPGEYRQESVNEFGCYTESACIPINTETHPPPIDKRFICPSLPTVNSCPTGEEKVVSFASPECGSYYVCRPKPKEEISKTKYPYTFKGGRIVVSFEEARIYCYESGPGGATQKGDVAECGQTFGISVPSIPPEKQCAQYGNGWHTMDASGNCFNPEMTEYRTPGGTLQQGPNRPLF